MVIIGAILGGAVATRFVPGEKTAHAAPAASGAEARVRALGLELKPPGTPSNTYVNTVRVGDMLYVSGTGPGRVDGQSFRGKLGQDLDIAQGQAAARSVGVSVLGKVRHELGSLDKVVRVVKTLGMVNAAPDFESQPKVVNGFSDLMVEVFGEAAGKGARSAVGMGSLPGNIPIEIEVIFQVRD
jgi:enamine deaminase RidA (YjgF/YER057c/UK114 family)